MDTGQHAEAVAAMLADLEEAERLLTALHGKAMELGDDEIIEFLDSELFWKLQAAGNHLRERFGVEQIYGEGV